jgi:ankyrin repeat protein
MFVLMTFALAMTAFAGKQREARVNEEFHKAIAEGRTEDVRRMLRDGPSAATSIDAKGVSAVLKATYFRKSDIVAAILATGIELNVFEAAATGNTTRLHSLVTRERALANAYSPDGFTPLGLASFFGHVETVRELLGLGADVNAASRETMKVAPLHSAAAAQNVAIGKLLIAKGADVNAQQADQKFTALHEVAMSGQLDFAKLLLDSDALINATTSKGKTPLDYAVEANQKEMAEYLKKRGAR